MGQVFGVGVVGCGIGSAHAAAWRALSGRFALRAICDVDRAKAAQLAQGSVSYGLYPAGGTRPDQPAEKPAEALTDFAELCRREDVDRKSVG
jgi:predicted dehydrogenase